MDVGALEVVVLVLAGVLIIDIAYELHKRHMRGIEARKERARIDEWNRRRRRW